MIGHRTPLALLALLAALAPCAAPARAGGDWNDAGIGWVEFEAGLRRAQEAGKPICLVFFTDWCPHCTSYSKVFHDPEVVERSRSFVMIRVDRDRSADLSARFDLDGTYIPRTYFLTSAGAVQPQIHAARDKYKYFYDENDPASLLAGMEAALSAAGPHGATGTGGGS